VPSALKNEIGQTFFRTSPEDDADGVQDENESVEGSQGQIPDEPGSYMVVLIGGILAKKKEC
jgi:hypothetical protein